MHLGLFFAVWAKVLPTRKMGLATFLCCKYVLMIVKFLQ
jgi:hypothetical protein